VENLIGKIAANQKETAQKTRKLYELKSDMRPITQVNPASSLGHAFKKLRRCDEPSDNSSSFDSDSDSESSTSDSSTSSGSSSLSSSSSHGQCNKCGKHSKKAQSKKRSQKHKKSLIKPTAPEKYDGTSDHQLFQQFLLHGTSYIKYGCVEKKHCVLILSKFLTGQAWSLYSHDVSSKHEKWTVEKFFIELFNYCFPVDY
jgi:hypothetical protein